MAETSDQEDFGFRKVPKDQKASMVRGVFDSVAQRYDVMNDLMSAGVHRIWKSVFLDRVNPRAGERLLDVAGGTGDVAAAFMKRASARQDASLRPPTECVVCDINHAMLVAGANRADIVRREGGGRDGGAAAGTALLRVCGDAERLPVPGDCFDAYTIAFGVRNVTDRAAALAEALRVLRRGGRFACLEFSRPTTDILQSVYDAYSFNVIPRLGEIVAGDRESYQYLVESIRRFPSQEAFADEIARAGFRRVSYENLSGGVVAMHFGWKL